MCVLESLNVEKACIRAKFGHKWRNYLKEEDLITSGNGYWHNVRKGTVGKWLGFFISTDKVGWDSWTRLVFSDTEGRLLHVPQTQNCQGNANTAELLLFWSSSSYLERDEAEFPLKFLSSPFQLCRLTPETFHSFVRCSLPSSGTVAWLSYEAEYLSYSWMMSFECRFLQ